MPLSETPSGRTDPPLLLVPRGAPGNRTCYPYRGAGSHRVRVSGDVRPLRLLAYWSGAILDPEAPGRVAARTEQEALGLIYGASPVLPATLNSGVAEAEILSKQLK